MLEELGIDVLIYDIRHLKKSRFRASTDLFVLRCYADRIRKAFKRMDRMRKALDTTSDTWNNQTKSTTSRHTNPQKTMSFPHWKETPFDDAELVEAANLPLPK